MIYLSSLIIDIIFGVWGALGKAWYWYPLNIILLFIASSMINTSFIQLLTRTYAIFSLKAPRAFSQIFGLTVFTLFLWAIAYAIGHITLIINFRIILFFVACIFVSTIVAFLDDGFQTAIMKTKELIRRSEKSEHLSEEQ
ncbi:MAG: hypothetical protein KQH63_10285 [Desulfobulbaceae bacterium]|nr:hypothetical protein [Desulfobulbaceae bacterium]